LKGTKYINNVNVGFQSDFVKQPDLKKLVHCMKLELLESDAQYQPSVRFSTA